MTINKYVIESIHDYNINYSNRDIYLNNCPSNVDNDNPGVEHRMADVLIKNIRILDADNNYPITVHMHSIGGDLFSGMAIFDSILTCRSHVTTIVYGQAESMSSIILQASDRRIMMPNAYFMLHYGSTGFFGHYLDAVNYMDFEKRYNERILNIYVNAFMNSSCFKESVKDKTYNRARSYIMRKLKNGDWFLDAEETVYHGFADCVLGSKECKDIGSIV